MNINYVSMFGGAPKKAAAKTPAKKLTSKKGSKKLTAPAPVQGTTTNVTNVKAITSPSVVPVINVSDAPLVPSVPQVGCNFSLTAADVPLSGAYTTIRCRKPDGTLSDKIGHGDKVLYNIFNPDRTLNQVCVRNNDNAVWCTNGINPANYGETQSKWRMLVGNDVGAKNALFAQKCSAPIRIESANLSTFNCQL